MTYFPKTEHLDMKITQSVVNLKYARPKRDKDDEEFVSSVQQGRLVTGYGDEFVYLMKYSKLIFDHHYNFVLFNIRFCIIIIIIFFCDAFYSSE